MGGCGDGDGGDGGRGQVRGGKINIEDEWTNGTY